MKILYFDCFSGVSGDMILGALMDLGVPLDYLQEKLSLLRLDKEFTLKREIRQKRGITGTKAIVKVLESKNPILIQPGLSVNLVSPLHHENHEHRRLSHITAMINNSTLSTDVKNLSLKIFQIIAEAEASVHGIPLEEVHFHEVGAVDSIVDVVGSAIAFFYLNPDKVWSSSVQVGGGMVKCSHGIYPVPAPATARILEGIPIRQGLVPFETTTPTGAAILKAITHQFQDSFSFIPEKSGYGLGDRDLEIPNVLRVFLAKSKDENDQGLINQENLIIEVNIDDMSGEDLAHVIEHCIKKGALDAWVTPIQMKKNRPAQTLSILIHPEQESQFTQILLSETSTFGVRSYRVSRKIIAREFVTRKTAWGEIREKSGSWKFTDETGSENTHLKRKWEWEDLKIAAEKAGLSTYEFRNTLKEEHHQ